MNFQGIHCLYDNSYPEKNILSIFSRLISSIPIDEVVVFCRLMLCNKKPNRLFKELLRKDFQFKFKRRCRIGLMLFGYPLQVRGVVPIIDKRNLLPGHDLQFRENYFF
jgi:hypothetical protein